MPRLDPARTPLADPSTLPPLAAPELGRTLVVAPHADDESLGCGGAIALLVDLGLAVSVAFVSDGTKSHPNSRSHPPAALRALRESEARAALRAIGLDVGGGNVAFLGLPDTAVPGPGDEGFEAAVALAAGFCRASEPETLLLPWRRDPHCDHRASRLIFLAAAALMGRPPRVFEYPVWAYVSADPADLPAWGEVVARRLDVSGVLDRKRAAIRAHRSQTTALIDDDPAGFCLSPAMLAHFDRPWEVYLESSPP